MQTPLAERIRPKQLTDYVGQDHLVGKKGILSQQIENGLVPSLILWGPPGVGKTTLAELIAKESKRPFFTLSAINAGVKEVRSVIEQAKKEKGLFTTQNPILFIDEIHRFSKSQQDALLGAVEKGFITLIGATTENPSFEVIPALLSRCQVYTLKAFDKDQLNQLLQRALALDPWLQNKEVKLKETEQLIQRSGGDARKLLNLFELVVNASGSKPCEITNDWVAKQTEEKKVRYDKNGEQHYDIISAFIKSIRGSDPNAAVYWLARMVEGGEDVKFIARRMIIAASEDIGNANPTALIMANNTFQAVQSVGWPESRIILSQCATYLACSPKSNAAYQAINAAQKTVRQTGDLEVPLHLRNAPTQLMKDLNYGKSYIYPHDQPLHFVQQEYMPKEISQQIFYNPSNENSKEANFKKDLQKKWKGKYPY